MTESNSNKDAIYLANVAKIGNSKENIQQIENVLPEQEHKNILTFVKSQRVWVDEPWDAKSVPYEDIPKEIMDTLNKIFTITYEKIKNTYGIDINFFNKNNLNILRFPVGMELMPHVDTSSNEGNHIAAIYYINHDYLGGEICFPDFGIEIKPRSNSLIIFPGNENYVHEVKTVVHGARYSSSMWFQFTGSNFNKKNEWYN